MDIFETVKSVVAEQLCIDESEITMDSSFNDDLEADSLDIVELMMALEDEFKIEISDDDAGKISTIGDVVEYIKDRI